MYPRIQLQAGREKSLHFKHPWVFSRAIAKVPKNLQEGSLVNVVDENEKIIATGYYNRRSQIAIRVFAFEDIAIDQKFFVAHFQHLLFFRKRFLDLSTTNAFRLAFSESDSLPGLIVDIYRDYIVIQIHTLGMDRLRETVVDALVEVFKPKGIYERSDVEVRRKEGLNTLPKGVLYGKEPPQNYEILENGLKYFVDIAQGQKTGFFLDQRDNRLALRKYVSGKKVLNLFSYSGGFSVSAVTSGAKQVTSVDVSGLALELARKNFELNGHDPGKHVFAEKDVFDFLDGAAKNGDQYDVIIVDPPAFVKSKDSLARGTNAYIQLNQKALHLLSQGGILLSSSCSSHVSPELFRTVLFKSALQAKRDLIILEQKIQPPDHPLRVNFPEGEYLKFFVCVAY